MRVSKCFSGPIVGKGLHFSSGRKSLCLRGTMLQPGKLVRVNLAGLQAGSVMFRPAITDAVGHIVKQGSEQPPKTL